MMKMAGVCAMVLTALCCSAVLSADAGPECQQYAVEGRDSQVPLNYELGDSDTLRWYHDNVVIFIGKGNVVRVGKKDDIAADGSLKLRKLTPAMAGNYKPEIFDKDGKTVKNLKAVQLCVLAPVPLPTVTEKCEEEKVTYTCSVPNTADLTVAWLKNKAPIAKESGWSLQSQINDVSASDEFTCKVSNMAHSAVSKPFPLTCYKSIIPDMFLGISIWVFVGGGGGLVLVLILIVIVCCVRARRTRRMRVKEEGELRLQWTNTNHQPPGHQHQRHHHHQRPHQHQQHQQQQHQQQQQQQQQQQHHQHHQQQQQQQQQQPAGHTGPRPARAKQPRGTQRPRVPEPPAGHPQPSPRRHAQPPRAVDTSDSEQPPPLPQPRKKGPRAQLV